MKKIKYLAISLISLIYLTTAVHGFAKTKLPQRLVKESKQFLEDQIIHQEKAFLDALSESFVNLSKINQETLNLINSTFPAGKKYYKRITKNIQRCATDANLKLLGLKKPAGRLDNFLRDFLPDDAKPLEDLHSLILDYKTSARIYSYIGDEIKNTVYAEGAYHYYQRCIESFESSYGEDLQALLQRQITFYEYLGELAENYRIKDLKNILPSAFRRINTAEKLINLKVINKIELSNRSWAKQIILNGLNLLQKQLQLNKNFNLAVAKPLNKILAPTPAKLPDLIVSSIEIVIPAEVKKGTIIKVIAEIKNEGDLAAGHSKALVIFPNGSRKGRPVPKLLPKQSIKVTWRYKIRRKGEHAFYIIANYNQLAWEANTDNNTTSRTLVLPRCD